MTLSAVIITKNEEALLADCLRSLSFCDETVVVDSGSDDGTVRIAEACGARIFKREFDNFAEQKNYAVSKASGDWVLSIDADERIPAALAEEIRAAVRSGQFFAYAVPRRTYFLGKLLKYGGSLNDRPVRLFRKASAAFQSPVHETLRIEGETGSLNTAMVHLTGDTVGRYLNKLNHFTDLEARKLRGRGKPLSVPSMLAMPLLRFFQVYFVKRGLLDGHAGFVYALWSGYYEFIRHAKHHQAFNKVDGLKTKQ